MSAQRHRVAISGASGLVGSALARELEERGTDVLRLVRRSPGDGEVEWRPESGLADPEALEGAHAVVHLAGESLANGRWTASRKQRFRSSRVDATERLVASLRQLERPPTAFLCASAVGFYGDRGTEELDESSAAGSGFLADLCVDWERAALDDNPCERVVHLRFGVVLDASKGALPKMLTPARLGLGGALGSGRQHFPWISRNDAVAAILWILDQPEVSGGVNLVAPAQDTSASFAAALGRQLQRPAFLKAPSFALRLGLGEMADEMLLASQRARPRVLERHGFSFEHPDAARALAAVLSSD